MASANKATTKLHNPAIVAASETILSLWQRKTTVAMTMYRKMYCAILSRGVAPWAKTLNATADELLSQ